MNLQKIVQNSLDFILYIQINNLTLFSSNLILYFLFSSLKFRCLNKDFFIDFHLD